MAEIIHRMGIEADPEKVFRALSTIEGLAEWWTENTSGTAVFLLSLKELVETGTGKPAPRDIKIDNWN